MLSSLDHEMMPRTLTVKRGFLFPGKPYQLPPASSLPGISASTDCFARNPEATKKILAFENAPLDSGRAVEVFRAF